MIIEVHMFARARDLAGKECLQLELPSPPNVGELRRQLAIRCPALAALLPRCAIAVNDEFAGDDVLISGASRIAVLPPVSGGSTIP